jgi:hypothetical protein
MVESTRIHERVGEKVYDGFSASLDFPGATSSHLFVPQQALGAPSFDLLIHFHGASYVTDFAATKFPSPLIAVTINLGSGSSRYNDGFLDTMAFPGLIEQIQTVLRQKGMSSSIKRIFLSGFSAGYGAVRRILSSESNYARVWGVLLLDGIHASYIPERTVLAEGGAIDMRDLEVFLHLARDASRPQGTMRFLITHSEIFPGTFVSTTEATDYLLTQLGLHRTPVLEWGPVGMQLLSKTSAGHFEVLGFAGNSAIDHVDHLHGLSSFLILLSGL